MNTLPPNDGGNTPAATSEFHVLAASLTEILEDTTFRRILEKSDADIAPEEFAGFIETLHQRMEEAIATAGGRAAQLPGIAAVRDTIEYFRRTAGERISVFVLTTLPMNIMILREQARAGAESLDAMATSGPA